jgi:hypothetical protein
MAARPPGWEGARHCLEAATLEQVQIQQVTLLDVLLMVLSSSSHINIIVLRTPAPLAHGTRTKVCINKSSGSHEDPGGSDYGHACTTAVPVPRKQLSNVQRF